MHSAPNDRPYETFICLMIISIIALLCIFFVQIRQARGEEWTDTQIVNAIFVIEGGYRAQYLYGIRSVPYKTEAEARRICYNTVRNNRVRYVKYGYKKYPDYLSFLASRYCPTSGKLSNAEQRVNKYWLGNLRSNLTKGR